jgi:hypothetical protein
MPKNKNISLSTNSDNQLLVKTSSKDKPKALNGRFSSQDNSLIFLVNKAEGWYRDLGLPNKLRLRGRWELTKEHNLRLRLDDFPGTLTLSGRIQDPQKNLFTFIIGK